MPSDSMNIGVTGMNAYQQEIDIISNNIANVGTTGYKAQGVTFQDLLYQTQLPASGPTATSGGSNAQQIGIGVKVGSTDTDLTQGGIQTTGVNTNMMVNGDGYFILGNSDGTGTRTYTRDGDFSLNQNGMLYDPSSGLSVMGFPADAQGIVTAAGAPGPIQIPIGLKATATATGAGTKLGPANDKVFDMTFAGNLDSTQYAAAVSNGAVYPGNLISSGTTIYDSLGDPHLVDITFSPVLSNNGANANPTVAGMPFQVVNAAGIAVTAATEWSYTLTSTDGTLFKNPAGTNGTSTTSPTQYVFFDQEGQFINTSGTEAPPYNAAGPSIIGATEAHTTDTAPSLVDGNALTVSQWGPVTASDNAATPGATNSPPGPLGLDFSAMTSNAAAASALSTGQNGVPPGILSNVSVGNDGTITGSFTNGQIETLARVSLATFQNQQGLRRLGGSQYAASVNSGEPEIGTAGTGSLGTISGDQLEMSNVSIADEFTKLITAQNAFAANSKSITTANENLQTVLNLIH